MRTYKGVDMQPLNKQELQQAVQQLRDSILGQVATKNDINNAVNAMSQKMFCQADMQRALDASRDRFMDKLGQPFRQQQVYNQQVITQLEQMNRRLNAIEARLGTMHGHLKSVRVDTEAVAHRTEPVKHSMLSQVFS